ncbi:hypothetical protein [Haloferula rosea]|uniref:DUF1570 domain-containing protein n=1 Tax=Haloferula rosea TaxID=490093 RepID=A0A934VEV2_9BACT|nr:hypothetical protein [Haloferula rosea]MBK1827704.1 hypothetical protein [Haloferula rosea]
MRLLLLLVLHLNLSVARADPQRASSGNQPVLIEDEAGRRTWHTSRLSIQSTANLSPRDLNRLVTVAEATVRAVAAHPLPLFKPPSDERLRIIILHDDASYVAEGGRVGSAGMYLWRQQCVILHAQHLFRSLPASRLRAEADESLVVHELVHLCMHSAPPNLPQWLKEGICEYFAAAHQGAGKFRFDQPEQSIRRHLRKRFDPADPEIPVAPIHEIAGLDARQWSAYLDRLPLDERLPPYATALLLTHYYLHGSKERQDLIRRALETPTKEAREPVDLHLRGENSKILEQLGNYWRPKGLQLKTSSSLPATPAEESPNR